MPEIYCNRINNVLWSNAASGSFNTVDGIHIWRTSVSAAMMMIDVLLPVLNAGELGHAASYQQEKDRQRFIIGRSMLRLLLGQYLGLPPADIQFETGSNKKPYVLQKNNSQLHVSVSHSGDWALVAIANVPVGVDVEEIADGLIFNDMRYEYFSEEENNYINDAAQPLSGFYLLWTRKEALTKATTKGVDNDMALIPCLDGLHKVSPKIINSGENWQVSSFEAAENKSGETEWGAVEIESGETEREAAGTIGSIAYSLPVQTLYFRETSNLLRGFWPGRK